MTDILIKVTDVTGWSLKFKIHIGPSEPHCLFVDPESYIISKFSILNLTNTCHMCYPIDVVRFYMGDSIDEWSRWQSLFDFKPAGPFVACHMPTLSVSCLFPLYLSNNVSEIHHKITTKKERKKQTTITMYGHNTYDSLLT